MTVLTDSDVVIEAMRGRDRTVAQQWATTVDSDILLACSPVTVAELWRGARPSETAALDALFGSLVCIPIDGETGRLAGDLMREFSRSHNVDLADALIAASTIVHEAELWTRNRKHYPSRRLRFFNPGHLQ